MPNQSKGQPSQGGHNGGAGAAAGVRDQAQAVGQKIQDGASQLGERVSEGYGQASEALAHRYRQAEGIVARNPGQSVLMGFGVGFGLGVLLTVLLTRREEESWAARNLPESLRNLPESAHGLADRIRNLHIADAIAKHLPGR